MSVACRFGNPQRILGLRDGLAESAEMRKHEPQPRPRPRREERRQPGSLGGAIVCERLRRFEEERARLRQVAERKVGLGEPILRLNLEAHVAEFSGNVESLPTGRHCAIVISHVPETRPDVSEHES
jgi:hypothetical protein